MIRKTFLSGMSSATCSTTPYEIVHMDMPPAYEHHRDSLRAHICTGTGSEESALIASTSYSTTFNDKPPSYEELALFRCNL